MNDTRTAMHIARKVSRNWRPLTIVMLFLATAWAIGCEYSVTSNPDVSLVSVSLTPTQATLGPEGKLTVTASIAQALYDSTLTWQLVGGLGTLTVTGHTAIYTAPSVIDPSPSTVQIIVRANEDTTRTAVCTITLTNNTTSSNGIVTINPMSVSITPGTTQQFFAAGGAVRWKMISGPGSVSSDGLYSAPASIAQEEIAVIQATLAADTSAWAQATVAISNDTLLCFSRDVLPIFGSSCTMDGCHDATTREAGFNFSQYADIRRGVEPGNARASRIYNVISTFNLNDRMPPPPHAALTSNQIRIIGNWINQGAQNTICDNTGPCDTSNIHYSTVIRTVVQNYCLGCHSGKEASNGQDFSKIEELQRSALSGELMGAINHAPGLVPMPQNLPKLDECTIAKIQVWVNHGAPND